MLLVKSQGQAIAANRSPYWCIRMAVLSHGCRGGDVPSYTLICAVQYQCAPIEAHCLVKGGCTVQSCRPW